ncbi:hypothetical protein LC612_28015 [Nostoc sp. CHAB 5834]|nr:hypothetical protein [Nostoc sp. CHAB 5834]
MKKRLLQIQQRPRLALPPSPSFQKAEFRHQGFQTRSLFFGLSRWGIVG